MRYTRQPPLFSPIDRSNSLGSRVIEYIPLNGTIRGSVGGVFGLLGSGGSIAPSAKGLGLRSVGTSASRASIPLDLSTKSRITIAFWMYWDAFANDDALALEFGSVYTVDGFLIDPNASGAQAGMFLAGVGSSAGSNLIAFARPTGAAWHRIALSFDRSVGVTTSTTAWVDGIRQSATLPFSQTVTGNFSSNTLNLLSRNGVSLFGSGNLQDITIYDGVFSDVDAFTDNANPWQILKFPTQRRVFAVINGILSAIGSATGSSTVTSATNSVFTTTGISAGSSVVNTSANALVTSSGASSGSSSISGIGNTILSTTASTIGIATVAATSQYTFGVSGSSTGNGSAQATSVSITQSTASSTGSSTVSAASITIGTSTGSSIGSATLLGIGSVIWQVSGSATGFSTVSGNGADASGGTTTISAAGSSVGSATVSATTNALSQAIANAFGSSVVGAQGALIAAVIANATGTSTVAATSGKVIFTSGSSTGSSSVSANANSVVGSVGTAAGTSSAQSAVLIIYQAQGFAPGVADAQAAARAIQQAIGQSTGTCVVAGITQGGVHYIGKGDHLSVTLILSPYEITLNDTSFNIIKN